MQVIGVNCNNDMAYISLVTCGTGCVFFVVNGSAHTQFGEYRCLQ